MFQKLRKSFARQIQFLTVFMALFFSSLAVIDSFDKVDKSVFQGEFIEALDFDYFDFPETFLRNQSLTKVIKIKRIEITKVFDYLVPFVEPKAEFILITFLNFTGDLPYFQLVLEKIISSNAP